MAFNAEDNWDFPVADVLAAEAAIVIRPGHAAPVEANPGAVLQAAVLQREIQALGVLLQPPRGATGLPAPAGPAQVPRPGQASLPTLPTCSADGWFLFSFVEHLGYIRMKIEATGKHFAQTNHTLAEMKVKIIERVSPNTETLRLVRESKWIQDFNANNKGLNRIS
jgi:hypothetical protein